MDAKTTKEILDRGANEPFFVATAALTFRSLNAPELLTAVYAGAQYVDGTRSHRVAQQVVAARFHLHTS